MNDLTGMIVCSKSRISREGSLRSGKDTTPPGGSRGGKNVNARVHSERRP